MSSNSNSNTLTKEQLFACLEYDGLEISADIIRKAKNNNGQALRNIGYEYESKLKDYPKAMAWYQLGADQNNPSAYNSIGCLYHLGHEVSQDYFTAMEYYLKAARHNHTLAMSNIALLFLNGYGVPLDKYKALEWYIKSGTKPDEVKKLNEAGIHLREEDKNKIIYQLANDAEDIIREERIKRESELKEEIAELKARESTLKAENDDLNKVKSSNEQEIQKLQNELQQQKSLLEQEKQRGVIEKGSSTQLVINMEQQLTDKMEIINSLKRESDIYQAFVQSKNNEINLLKKDSQRYENIEKENMELKRKLQEYQRYSQEPQTLIDNSNSANNATTASTSTNNTVDLDGQTPLTNNVDNITVKTEAEPENGNLPSCQNKNKKRRVTSNDS